MQKITPFLWFDTQAEEAAKYYCSIFKDSKITAITNYGKESANASGMKKGSVMTVAFELAGQDFTAINGGPVFKFNESISLVVNCDSQKEIDHYWDSLSAGGDPKAQMCGWLKDKYGMSWQIVPSSMGKIMNDPKKAEHAMKAILNMKKIEINRLEGE